MLDKIFGICAAIAEGTTEAAAAAGEDAAAEMTSGQIALQYLFTFAPIILIFVIFWFMMIRPQQRKEKERRRMIDELRAGAKIVFAGGLMGTIVEATEKTFRVEISPGTTIEIARGCVTAVVPPAGAEAEKK